MPASWFPSFWIAGFESACHINRAGRRIDMVAATQHDSRAREDYTRLRSMAMTSARDGLRWPLIERAGGFDFDTVLPMAQAALDCGIHVNWNLCHYGWPDDLDVFSPSFVDRFARYTKAVTTLFRDLSDTPSCFTLVNEISFLAWAAGEIGGFIHPHARGRGGELKRQLVRAVIAGIEAAREVDRRTRFLHVDPLIRVIPRRDRPQDHEAAARYTESQHEAWGLLSGRLEPELGGRPDYLDLMGFNFYHSNQWEHDGERLRWEDEPRDPRWLPLHLQLQAMWERYGRPMVLAETSHFGVGRARWILEIGDEIAKAIDLGVPIHGVCIYPIVDRPDWDDPDHWHNSGLWDVSREGDGVYRRVLNAPYAAATRRAQDVVGQALARRAVSR
jgi:beta-glucosidase/6-phospho-beta-glucosidase/beta-galactosidase